MEILYLLLLGLAAASTLIGVATFVIALFVLRKPRTQTPAM